MWAGRAGGAGIWAPILLGQFENKSEFETKHGKTCPFASKIESSISTLGGTFITELSLVSSLTAFAAANNFT